MGRISRRKLHESIQERMYDIFWEHLASLQSAEAIKEFLQSLLSYTEQVMLAKRLAIAILLSRGHSYALIDDKLKVSKATISTIGRQIHTGSPGYNRAIAQAKARRSKEELWDTLEEALLKLSLPARYGSARHQLKSAIGKDLYKKKLQRHALS